MNKFIAVYLVVVTVSLSHEIGFYLALHWSHAKIGTGLAGISVYGLALMVFSVFDFMLVVTPLLFMQRENASYGGNILSASSLLVVCLVFTILNARMNGLSYSFRGDDYFINGQITNLKLFMEASRILLLATVSGIVWTWFSRAQTPRLHA